MREKLEAYVGQLFADAALTIRNAEVKQEILQHTLDRYDDLIAAGKSEQEAYDEAVGGIGDVSGLYEHKKPEAAAEHKTREFPAPGSYPPPTYAASTKKSRKRLPGWAIALICVGAVLLLACAALVGVRSVYTALGGLSVGYQHYDSADSYDTLPRGGFGSEGSEADELNAITEVEIHWISGSVYILQSEDDRVHVQEDYTGTNEDYALHYKVDGERLIIQPCKSSLSSIKLPRKTLTVSIPKELADLEVETVSAEVELMSGRAADARISTTSGNIIGPEFSAQTLELSTVSGNIRLPGLNADTLSCESVSGDVSLGFRLSPGELTLSSVSGNYVLELPTACQYQDLTFDTVSGELSTDGYTPGTVHACPISAETVSGDLHIRTKK